MAARNAYIINQSCSDPAFEKIHENTCPLRTLQDETLEKISCDILRPSLKRGTLNTNSILVDVGVNTKGTTRGSRFERGS